MEKLTMVILGVVLALIGIMLGGGLAVMGFMGMMEQDPAANHHHRITGSGYEMRLEAGEYDVWYHGQIPRSLAITDPAGKAVNISVPMGTQSINENAKYGSFTIPADGTYTANYTEDATLYITDPVSVGGELAMLFGGICLGGVIHILGLVLIIVPLLTKK